jgi:predicted ester cyclase
MTRDLEGIYRAYIDTLNDRRFENLDQFVHEQLVYNDDAITREQYVAMLVDDVRAVPDLQYGIDLLVANEELVSARLWFDCSPRGRFLGIDVDGRRVTFAEHVLYRLRQGRIERVWSLLDRDAIRVQAAGE